MSDRKIVRVVEHSFPLRCYFANMAVELKQAFKVTLSVSNRDLFGDAIFMHDREIVIQATDDGRYFVRPTIGDPTDVSGDVGLMAAPILHHDGMGTHATERTLAIPKSCLGAYASTPAMAVQIATYWDGYFTWETLPKEFNPPLLTQG